VTHADKDSDLQATPPPDNGGPSWGLMLALIFLAMLIAIGFAWLFIHPLLNRH